MTNIAQFTNQASLSYSGITIQSNVVTGEVTQVLKMWKDSTVDVYRANDIITYVISIQNAGNTNITDLTLTDNLGAYTYNNNTLVPLTYTGDVVLYYQNGILQAPPNVVAGPPLVITGINVLAGTSTILVYRTRVNEFAPLLATSTITNTATLTGGGLIDAINATNTITINENPNLTITKAINPTTVIENEQVTYTFTIENTGATPADASAAIVITDTFNPILENISVTLNGVAWPQADNYTYNEATGLFTTIAGQITVPAATYTVDPTTGTWSIAPGITVLEITGRI